MIRRFQIVELLFLAIICSVSIGCSSGSIEPSSEPFSEPSAEVSSDTPIDSADEDVVENTEMADLPAKYSKEFLAKPGVLLKGIVVPLNDDPSQGVFIGVYGKDHFTSLDHFVQFTANVSSITQDWYSTGDLESAYSYYFPPESNDPEWSKEMLRGARVVDGSLATVLKQLATDVDLSQVPEDIKGKIYCCGETLENGVIGEGDGYYFEAYIADR